MRTKTGIICIVLGIGLIAGSMALFFYNQGQDQRAGQACAEVLPQLVAQIPSEPREQIRLEQLIPAELKKPEDLQMTETVIDGDAYIGYLAIPALSLELPILAEWSYPLLQKAPCRYTGSTKSNDLVLMAHNYEKHFGRIASVPIGDNLYFTDMDGITTVYTVVARDVLAATAIEEMTAGDFDLTLFTCTYGGKSRVTVYCDRLDANS